MDALCKRLGVDNSGRTLHGALLDAQILAEVYLVLTGGQGSLSLEGANADQATADDRATGGFERPQGRLPLVTLSDTEQSAHDSMLEMLRSSSEEGCLWDDLAAPGSQD